VYICLVVAIKFDIMSCKRAFYSDCNCIFMYGSDMDELALPCLQESYRLPIIDVCCTRSPKSLNSWMNWMSAGTMWLGSYLMTIMGVF